MSIVINGTGTIAGLSAGGLPSATVTQPTLATGVAGTGPALLVTLSTNQTIATTTLTTVALNSVIYDTSSRFNNTGSTVGGIPAYSFMPTVAGYYLVSATVNVESSVTLSRWILNISTSGSTYRLADNYYSTGGGTAGTTVSSGSSIVYLNGTTDYVQLSVYIAAATPVINSGVATTRFSVGLLRSA